MKLNKWREIPEDKKGHIITGMMIGAVTTGLVSRSFDLCFYCQHDCCYDYSFIERNWGFYR